MIISNDSKGDPQFEINILVSYKILENGKIILKREIEKVISTIINRTNLSLIKMKKI